MGNCGSSDEETPRRQIVTRDTHTTRAHSPPRQQRGPRQRGRSIDRDQDYRDIFKVLMYKNGDEFDQGTIITVSRKQFKNWIMFLDYLSKTLNMTSGAVHKIYDLEGNEKRHFIDLIDGGSYVASTDKFRHTQYGTRKNPGWNKQTAIKYYNPQDLNSTESQKIYLKSNNFRPHLGDMWEDERFDEKQRRPIKSAAVNGQRQPHVGPGSVRHPHQPQTARGRSAAPQARGRSAAPSRARTAMTRRYSD